MAEVRSQCASRLVVENRNQSIEVDGQNAAKKTKSKKIQPMLGQSYVLTYTQWYCELLKDKGTSGTGVISPNMKAIVSLLTATFQATMYTHPGGNSNGAY